MGEQRRVLVVDDSDVIRRLIVVNLELEGFAVEEVGDGAACLARLDDFKPHVITLDVVMPELDGLETVRRIRASLAFSAVRILMVTAKAQDSDRARARELGADDYLTKPFDPARLVSLVRELAG